MKNAKYQAWYDALIERARSRQLGVYKERHHVLPRSLGGGDEEANLVDLTYREHFLVHWLLVKVHVGASKRVMVHALHAMTLNINGSRIAAGWQYEVAKRVLANAVFERRRERERIKLDRIEQNRAVYLSAMNAARDVAGSIVGRTPWKARKLDTVVTAREDMRGIITSGVGQLDLRSAVGRRAASQLSSVWLECSGDVRQLRKPSKRKQAKIQFPGKVTKTLVNLSRSPYPK